ncbi:unnamed protein product [Bursaphelenchus okinawaensis]|uniref:Hexosyltransferase n=1 Tax=Bursaphelenchus okinawaensis TaxID=465554 RepID=A0A811KXB1_9BILA|nr:unnamed protein product [Bursaphelenchus okinawaensis]CAG9113330.1 unnamed protein product [Bursaphelenchus okinawaensis]
MRMFEAMLEMDEFRLELNSYWTNYKMQRPRPGTCDNTTLFVAIMTTSDVKSYKQRMAIRKYALDRVKGQGVVAKFFLGHQPGFRYDLVKDEMEKYDDMVYFDSDDNYRNNFVKWYAMYQYHQRYCSQAKYFVKIDDDTAVDWKRVIKWTERHFDGAVEGKKDFLVCQRFIGMRPVRNKEHIKWYISPKEYNHRFWPTYCYGYIVLMTNSTVAKLSEASKGMPLIHMDDVLYTGLAARAAKVPVYDFEGFRESIHPRYPCTEDGLPYPTAIHLQKTPKAMARTIDKLVSLNCDNDDLYAP